MKTEQCKRSSRTGGFLFLLMTLALLSALSVAQELSDEKLFEALNKLANIQKGFLSRRGTDSELHLKEVDRGFESSSKVVRYQFFAPNFPKNQEYVFGILRINQQIQAIPTKKTLDQAGRVVDGPDDPFEIETMAAKGEPYRFVLSSADGKYKAYGSVVPFPIESSDGSCSLEAILLLPDAEAILLQGSGFKPGDNLTTDIDSEGEKHSGTKAADSTGGYSSVLAPYKKGSKKGTVTVVVKSADCHPTLKINWGKGTYHTE